MPKLKEQQGGSLHHPHGHGHGLDEGTRKAPLHAVSRELREQSERSSHQLEPELSR